MDHDSATIETAVGPTRSARNATILAVEDSPVQGELLRRAFEGAGYEVLLARDGAEGLALAKAHHPAAVVSDINMPVMDGYAMCQAIRREDSIKFTPVILLTMLSDAQDVIRGLNAGADAYMTKPYNVPTLIARVESLLAYPPAPPPPVERRKVEIRLSGQTHLVDAHGPRMLNLLISTYENAVLQNRELLTTQQALEDLNRHLEQKVLEKTAALQASERRFRSLIENASDLVAVIDANGVITYVSPSIARLGDYQVPDIIGTRYLDYMHPADRPGAESGIAEIRRVSDKPHVTELRFRHRDGRWLTLESIARNALDDPAIRGIVVNSRDVTERKQAQEALAKKERYYRKLIEGGSDTFFVIDCAGTLLHCSESVTQLTGWDAAQVLYQPVTDYVAAASLPAARDAIAYALAHPGELHRVELSLLRSDATRVPVEILGRNLLDDPDVGGIVITARDISERKRAEEELRRLNWALRALGQSNSALVHAGTEEELFQSCCTAIAGAGGYPLAWIGLSQDDATRSVKVAAAAGAAIELVQGMAVSWSDAPQGRGPTGTAIRSGATQVNNNLAEGDAFSSWIERARAHGLASSISLPIRTDAATVGALIVFGHEPDAFGQAQVDLFEELAADIGYGIASRRTRVAYEAGLLDRERTTRQLRAAFESLIAVLAATVERRDPYTAGHQRRVAALAQAIGRALSFNAARLEGLYFAATIHDIGKIYVPAEILARPGKLPPPEFELIKSHAQIGYDIVKGVDFPWQVADMIRQHHERMDGSGYPQGLQGDQILLEARILAVADTVEAMSSHRPYRPGLGLEVALAQIRKEAGTKLDAQVVDACERAFREQGFSFSEL